MLQLKLSDGTIHKEIHYREDFGQGHVVWEDEENVSFDGIVSLTIVGNESGESNQIPCRPVEGELIDIGPVALHEVD
ncbi:MAG: hypothetical protein V3V10_00680 [Planctomycetota bacterium]